MLYHVRFDMRQSRKFRPDLPMLRSTWSWCVGTAIRCATAARWRRMRMIEHGLHAIDPVNYNQRQNLKIKNIYLLTKIEVIAKVIISYNQISLVIFTNVKFCQISSFAVTSGNFFIGNSHRTIIGNISCRI